MIYIHLIFHFLFYILTIIVPLGLGQLANKVLLKKRINEIDLGFLGLLGFFTLYFLSNVIHLIFPINNIITILVFIVAIISFIYFTSKKILEEKIFPKTRFLTLLLNYHDILNIFFRENFF